MKQWEYCVIAGVGYGAGQLEGSYPVITYFSKSGVDKVYDLGNRTAKERKPPFNKYDEPAYISATIAGLGLEGWEMAAVAPSYSGQGTGHQTIYFRREIVKA